MSSGINTEIHIKLLGEDFFLFTIYLVKNYFFSDTADEFESVHKGFMKERSKLETEYALKLKRLVKTYSSKVDKKKNENDEEFTRAIAFR